MADDAAPPPDLSDVRIRRARLRRAVLEVGARLEAPLPGRAPEWTAQVAVAVQGLARSWETHVALNEVRGGLFDQVVADAPRVAPAVARLRREHADVAGRLAAAGQLLASDLPGAPEEARELLTALLATIIGHRQRGADMIYQAYHVDIGGE